jgi:SAM-dependent methyltransferase
MTGPAAAPPCSACLGTRSRALGSKDGWPLWECRACRSVFTKPEVPSGDLAALYDGGYVAELPPPASVVASLERVVAACEPFRSSGRWLDVGYGQGDLLEIVQRRGWSCFGTEVAPAALARGARRGWTVGTDVGADARFPQGGFDVVTMVELIEHVRQPRSFLKAAAGWLRPGGLLYLTTPNGRSLNRRALGLAWTIVCPPEHLTLWSGGALRRALRDVGLQPLRLRSEGLNPAEILLRFRGAPQGSPAYNRNEAAQRLSAALASSPARRAFKRAANEVLTWLRLGDTLKAWALRPEATEEPRHG